MLLFAGMAEGAGSAGPGAARVVDDGPVAVMARIRGGAAGGLGLWAWGGTVFGRRPGEVVRPLLQVAGIGFGRVTRNAQGQWELAMSEAGYMGDLDTGAPLAEWRNPYTGRSVVPPPNRLLLRYRIADDGRIEPPFPGMVFDGQIGPVRVQGDTVWVSERLMANIPTPPAGSPKRGGPSGNPAEFSVFQARRADLDLPATAFVPATMSHQAVWGFYDWMEMGGQPGEIITQIVGTKLASPDELPAALRERLERDYPGLLANPGI